jgi:hypothetical protein
LVYMSAPLYGCAVFFFFFVRSLCSYQPNSEAKMAHKR